MAEAITNAWFESEPALFMSKAVKCPVCEGKGKVAPEGMWAGSPDSYPPCYGCLGKGWVEVDLTDHEKWETISPYRYGYATTEQKLGFFC